MHDAEVNADIERFWIGALKVKLGREGDEPTTAVLEDVYLFDLAGLHRAFRALNGNGTAVAVTKPADLGQFHSAVDFVDVFRLELRDAKSVPDAHCFEFRPPLTGGFTLCLGASSRKWPDPDP